MLCKGIYSSNKHYKNITKLCVTSERFKKNGPNILNDNNIKSGGSGKIKILKKMFQEPCIVWKKACETETDYVTQNQ